MTTTFVVAAFEVMAKSPPTLSLKLLTAASARTAIDANAVAKINPMTRHRRPALFMASSGNSGRARRDSMEESSVLGRT
jgi:hypothetical protein